MISKQETYKSKETGKGMLRVQHLKTQDEESRVQ